MYVKETNGVWGGASQTPQRGYKETNEFYYIVPSNPQKYNGEKPIPMFPEGDIITDSGLESIHEMKKRKSVIAVTFEYYTSKYAIPYVRKQTNIFNEMNGPGYLEFKSPNFIRFENIEYCTFEDKIIGIPVVKVIFTYLMKSYYGYVMNNNEIQKAIKERIKDIEKIQWCVSLLKEKMLKFDPSYALSLLNSNPFGKPMVPIFEKYQNQIKNDFNS